MSILLGWIEEDIVAIPEIQRPFVWKSSKVRDLLDSLYKERPWGQVCGAPQKLEYKFNFWGVYYV
ncbi:DUF262 domain-containing protein [Oceanobacillus arenosus]|uniref:DUF262 domain-containing protein n=1 Tax=Oceanobacillus arenosus TaxID=1229153 RepID=UPI003CCC6587